ncbi:MAG: type II toxin-antitoxin system VapC family toxin [Verrucomicrobiota bacterium]
MKAYADTSFLVSLYVSDAHTAKAAAWMKHHPESLPFTPLHRHEFRNAIRLAVWRKELDGAQRREIFRLVDLDLREGILIPQSVAWIDAFREAERIGGIQTESTGLRAADLLHLGVASLLEVSEFLSFDAIQRKAAAGAGLKCKP